MKWCRVEQGVVVETTQVDVVGRFHPEFIWLSCPDEVELLWTYDGEVFQAP